VTVLEKIATALKVPTAKLLSANCDGATMRRGEPAHPIGWLGKPFEPSQLATIIAAVLRP